MTVGVAVVRDPQVGVVAPHGVDEPREMLGARLRGRVAERCVVVTAPPDHRRPRGFEEGVGDPAPAPVHGVVDDGQALAVGGDEGPDLLRVGGHDVDAFDGAAGAVRTRFGESRLDVVGHLGERRRAVPRDELHAVVLGRVVGGGDHQRPRKAAVDDGPRD